MTVRNVIPIIEYTGNAVITKFDWDWDMIDDSSINVLVDNENVTNWEVQDQSVVFDTAPEIGAFIQIYRRTLVRMPEDYFPFGRFHSEKTELSVDRATLIAQEYAGDRGNGNAPNGIVGAPNLSITRGQYTVTVVSERGTDAVLPMYDPDGVAVPTPGAPDPTIAIWAGAAINAGVYSLPGNTNGVAATIRFRMDLLEGDPTKASAFWPNFNAFSFTSWNTTDPSDNEYWIRVNIVGDVPTDRFQIYDPVNGDINLGVEFQIRAAPVVPFGAIIQRDGDIVSDSGDLLIFPRDAEAFDENVFGPFVTVYTFGDVAPSTQIGIFNIEICKDDGTGQPDDKWASRIVTLEAILNA